MRLWERRGRGQWTLSRSYGRVDVFRVWGGYAWFVFDADRRPVARGHAPRLGDAGCAGVDRLAR